MSENPFLPPPKKVFGFTYVSFFIEKTTFPSRLRVAGAKSHSTTLRGGDMAASGKVEKVGEPTFFLRISVYNGKGKLTEAQQVGDKCR